MRWLARAACVLLLAAQVAVPPRAAASTGELVSQLDGLVKSFPGGAGVYVADPNIPTPLYLRDPDEQIITASLYKLAVLLETERRVDERALGYDGRITIEAEDITDDGAYETAGTEMSIDEALELMITVSDNGTALALYHLLGPEKINATLEKAGIADFHVAVNDDEDNYATPRAIGQFFTLLANRTLISPAASDRMLARLKRQTINDRLPAQLPENVVVAHKTGNLVGVVHDAGVIYTSFGPRVVVAMTWDVADDEANEFIRNVGSLVYSAILEPPASARYVVPRTPVFAEIGTRQPVELQITNAGTRAWPATGDGAIGLIWEVRDAKEALVGTSAAPIPLGALPASASTRISTLVGVPGTPGDYRVTIGLVDARGVALSRFGAATAAFTLRAHVAFVAAAQVQMPIALHRLETTLLIVQFSALPALGGDAHSMSLGWRAVDETTSRVVAQGATLLGTILPGQRSGTFFAPFVAPAVRGSYRLDYELRERENIASETQSTKVEILGPRSFPGDRESMPTVGPFLGAGNAVQPRATPRPSATAQPRGRTPTPSPRR